MAKKSLIKKQQKQPKFRVQYKRFMLCRICFRQLAHAGELPGVTKSSW